MKLIFSLVFVSMFGLTLNACGFRTTQDSYDTEKESTDLTDPEYIAARRACDYYLRNREWPPSYGENRTTPSYNASSGGTTSCRTSSPPKDLPQITCESRDGTYDFRSHPGSSGRIEGFAMHFGTPTPITWTMALPARDWNRIAKNNPGRYLPRWIASGSFSGSYSFEFAIEQKAQEEPAYHVVVREFNGDRVTSKKTLRCVVEEE